MSEFTALYKVDAYTDTGVKANYICPKVTKMMGSI